ncbi:tetratricopeptide repeat protein [Pseudoalteromonas luteoviolacea]|uniref:MalT-like TPR region domain-containing protein n=1 Tax=Pseudoalteromonas luteoviolacea S4054 TaxID=1129367 RepID=A0A0F6AAX9_9GAMM|nr:hypothetical protein [Pseudoalteromonas luteoviolacea]AOT06862.1 hypothetical protein S4054249_02765 [Pseudoalteromonas luteoviolacea]AOT11780.1 hypothetical protein S40542_02765 [Pseudoalteromonas luteoviolacea]AOT16692.1 hypothetical protein S4054_02765 [Pseudoalteromonas luteoviolacea]KKE83357.1 hypothetical protein N479_14540 [Pseudoalteromonas luteoviolacea S4054]KZN74026.1 hypothetical protein N481_09945 [Pseudoalteromonas luteoviolacea S4047-1]
MEIWCSGEDLLKRANVFAQQLNRECHPHAAVMIANAFVCSEQLPFDEKTKISSAISQFLDKSGNGNLQKELLPIESSAVQQDQELVKLLKLLLEHGDKTPTKETQQLEQKLLESSNTLMLGCFYYILEQFEKAEHYLKQLDDAGARFMLLVIYSIQEQTDQVIELAYECIKEGYFEAALLLAYAYVKQRDFSEAEKHYLLAIEKKVESSQSKLANFYYDRNKMELAEKYALLAYHAGEDEALFTLLAIYQKQSKYDEAETLALTEISKGNTDERLYISLVFSRIYQGKLDAVESYLQTEQLLHYNFIAAHFYLAKNELEQAKTHALNSYQQDNFSPAHKLLALIYTQEAKYDLAEKHLLEVASEDPIAQLKLASLYFNQPQLKPKEHALSLIAQIEEIPQASNPLVIQILLWNNQFDQAAEKMSQILSTCAQQIDDYEETLIQLFTFFLAKGQTNLVCRWFKEYDLSERFKPLYYALMSLMESTYPNEHLRMGSELQETVDEILQHIDFLAQTYK